jgi:hypothetical protein
MPSTAGNGCRAWAAWPARIFPSNGLRPLALILTNTWPAPATGLGIVVSRNGASTASTIKACISVMLAVSRHRRMKSMIRQPIHADKTPKDYSAYAQEE